jgi:hypothetical protein
MSAPRPQESATPVLFLSVVLSSIGTAAGLLIITASFFFGTNGSPDLPAGGFFQSMRIFAMALTALCAVVLAISLGHFGGHEWARSGRMRALMIIMAAAVVTALVFTTLT